MSGLLKLDNTILLFSRTRTFLFITFKSYDFAFVLFFSCCQKARDIFLFQNRLDIAESLCKLLPRRVHVLSSSLKIHFFAKCGRFNEALEEIENVLNEDNACLEVSVKLTKAALDEFYSAILTRNDMLDEVSNASIIIIVSKLLILIFQSILLWLFIFPIIFQKFFVSVLKLTLVFEVVQ